jgi:ricin-type beta-trefoil lectin protein
MRKATALVAATGALTAGLIGAQPAQAAANGSQLRNKETGLCIERLDVEDTARPVFMAPCDGGVKQQWVYSASELTIRTTDGLCLSTGDSTGVAVGACDSGLFIHWLLSADGRIHQADRIYGGDGCVEDYRTDWLTWGVCSDDDNEVWSLTAV